MAIWYRGETVGLETPTEHTPPHDFVNGVYFANRREAAEGFATFRTNDSSRWRLYEVDIDLSQMRVLDLRTDQRWQKQFREMPQLEQTIKYANMNYGRVFENWRKTNNIKLEEYDAIIGPLYSGGSRGALPDGHFQLCILNKDNKLAQIAIDIRTRMRPIPIGGSTGPITTRTPITSLKYGGRIGPGLRLAAGSIVTAIVTWLLRKKIEKLQQESLERDLEKAKPNIEQDIAKHKVEALEMLSNGAQSVYAVIRITIENYTMHHGPNVDWSPTAPALKYEGFLHLSPAPINKEDGEKNDYFNAPGSMMHIQYYKMSFDVSFSQEEVDLYRAYKNEIAWYEQELTKIPVQQDVVRLNRDRNALVDRFVKALGN